VPFYMGLSPTARHLTRTCFGPGVGRGMLRTMVYGSFGAPMVIPDWVAMTVVRRGKGLKKGLETARKESRC
jgi:hypothetical protein